MNPSFLRISSITKKIWMAFLGLFLMVFLVVHLSINLCLLRDDGGKWFTDAAHFMGTNYVVKAFEVVLFAGLIFHVLLGLVLQVENWLSRPVRYKITNKSYTPFLSKYMIYTGVVILIFLIIHFMNFYFIKLGWVQNPLLSPGASGANAEPDFYHIARALFANPYYSILYIILLIILAFHLNHAFQAAFQSLGLDHMKYSPAIRIFGMVYSIVIPLGFIIIPIYFLLIIG